MKCVQITVGLNEQEVLKNVSAVLLTVPIGDYGNPFNALNAKIFGWEIFAQFKFIINLVLVPQYICYCRGIYSICRYVMHSKYFSCHGC